MDFLDRTLENFREYLKENTDSKNTVKNYVSDLRIFLIFLDSRHSPITAENFSLFLNSQTLSEFEKYLSVINPPATLNRRVSSVKKFFDYYMEHHPLPPQPDIPPVTFSSPIVNQPTQPIQSTVESPPEPEVSNEPAPAVSSDTVVSSDSEITSNTSETNGNLLRLLPQEILDTENIPAGEHRNIPGPPNFLSKFKIQIICIISFLAGFFLTMAVYPILYP